MAPSEPAILLITTDQLRKDALECYGGKAVATPHLERLASSATAFDRAYCASPWCLPSRSSLATGLYPRKHQAYSNFRDVQLSPDIPNLYTVLGRAGYETAHIGKCHYTPVPYAQTRPDATLPYDDFRDYYLSLGMDHLILQDDKQVSVWYYDDYAADLETAGYLEAYRDAVWDRQAHKVFTFPGPTEWHPDSWVGRKSRKWIDAYDGAAPAFCWASFSGPHFPFDPPEAYLARVDEAALSDPVTMPGEFDDPRRIHHRSHFGPRGWIESGINSQYSPEYWRRLRRNYLANVALLDDEIGALIETAEAKFGDNLVIVFTSDHGEMLGNHGMWGKGNCFYEDVLSVPLLYRRPEQTSAGGARSDALVSLVDVFPTLVGIAGGQAGDVDGGDLHHSDHAYVFSEGEGFQVVTDGRYKLVTVRKDDAAHTELFDLEHDPYEFADLAGNPAHANPQRDLQTAALGALLESAMP